MGKEIKKVPKIKGQFKALKSMLVSGPYWIQYVIRRSPMANSEVIIHVISEKQNFINLIQEKLGDDSYILSFVTDAGRVLHVTENAIDIVFLQPSFVSWKWLDALIKIRREYPDLPVFLYSPEIGLVDGLHAALEDRNIFPINDLTFFKDKVREIVTQTEASKKKILFVDDDQNILNSYIRAFRKMPWKIFAASSGENALAILSEKPINLVVTDIKMPQMHGIELAAKIREHDKDIPIIVCSAYKGLRDDHNIKLHHVTSFVEKPIDLDVLRSKIEEMLCA